ncbi:MAG TPA: SprB repeat-containing protein [Actinospica sp.]|nr:SprB repeat-containing protein [Actinospica sp.]
MSDETERLTERFADQTEQTQRFEEIEQTQRLADAEIAAETQRLADIEAVAETQQLADTQAVAETQRFDSSPNPDQVETYVRFGPGIPAVVPAPDRATAIWRGEVRPVEVAQQGPERRAQRWIMPLTVLILVIAVLIYFFWGRTTTSVAVKSVAVTAATASVSCEGSERLTAVLTTNGGSGNVTYQWQRSDGTHSDVLTQNVDKGESKVSVTLLWNFDGYGTLDATATLRVISPGTAAGSATFRYVCAKQ